MKRLSEHVGRHILVLAVVVGWFAADVAKAEKPYRLHYETALKASRLAVQPTADLFDDRITRITCHARRNKHFGCRVVLRGKNPMTLRTDVWATAFTRIYVSARIEK